MIRAGSSNRQAESTYKGEKKYKKMWTTKKIKSQVINYKGNWLGKIEIKLGWTKKNWLEQDLNLWPPDKRSKKENWLK